MTGLMGSLSGGGHCNSFCSHGGVCELDLDHGGLHDSGYCQWADAEALTRDAADAVLRARGAEGEAVADLWDFMIAKEPGEERDA